MGVDGDSSHPTEFSEFPRATEGSGSREGPFSLKSNERTTPCDMHGQRCSPTMVRPTTR